MKGRLPVAPAVAALLLTAVWGPAVAQEPLFWNRWQARWVEAASLERTGGCDLLRLARADSVRASVEDSLFSALVDGEEPPNENAQIWARTVLVEALIEGNARALDLVRDPAWSAGEIWGRHEETALAAALRSMEAGSGSNRNGFEATAFPADEQEYAILLELETRLQRGDTLAAAREARRRIGERHWPHWVRVELERAEIGGALFEGDTSAALRALESFSGREEARGEWLLLRRRLARLRGREAEADSLLWRVVTEYPSGRTALRALRAQVPVEGALAPRGSAGELRRLLRAAEAHGDFARFCLLEAALRAASPQAGRDSLALRGGRLAFRAREYEALLGFDRSGRWRPLPRFAVEWHLITARALRNTGQSDSMSARYAYVVANGSPDDRRTALWEWARELESLGRFHDADSLYGRLVALGGGDLETMALFRRGICSVGAGDWPGARSRLLRLIAVGSPEERAAGWFWIYRAETERGRADSARVALARAARDRRGYYGWRAHSALVWARQPGGPSALDPAGYWRALEERTLDPALDQARLPSRDSTGLSRASRLERARRRLQLFRSAGRAEWARLEQEDLEERLLDGTPTRRRLLLEHLGLPDLAARLAIRHDLSDPAARFPTPYPAAVAGAARRFRVPPEWIWAIMRRESFFESGVVSSAGAVGLMQLMPATAETTARGHGLSAEPLRSPRVNLHLGVAHLRDLLSEEPGKWPVVLAAYNAGLHNARRWRREEDDPDFYIEMIGYRETREYVRRVLEGFWIYRSLLRGI